MGLYLKVSIMSCVEYILTNYCMAQKQDSVSLKCCYTVGAFPIRQINCINTRNNYFIVFYYQFGVNVFCHDDKLNYKVYHSSTMHGNTTAIGYEAKNDESTMEKAGKSNMPSRIHITFYSLEVFLISTPCTCFRALVSPYPFQVF